MKLNLTLTAGFLLAVAGPAFADYNPVALTPSSFQYDIVVEKTAGSPLENLVNCTIDSGTNDTGNTLCEQGYVQGVPYLGVPTQGSTFTSTLVGGHSYIMPPDFTTNSVAMVGAANIPGSGTLVTQVVDTVVNVVSPTTPYQYLSILYCASGQGALVTVTVTHLDGTVEAPQTISLNDWFHGAGFAYRLCGRIQVDGSNPVQNFGTFGSNPTSPSLYNADIFLSDSTSPVTKVDFAYNGTGSTANYRFFALAVSGSTDGSNFTPIPISGFNYKGVVSSNYKATSYFTQGYTVTMDDGPNADNNLFYEQGFCTISGGSTPLNVGTAATTISGGNQTGMPHPGATIGPVAASGNSYTFQMPPTYATNNCVFIGNYAAGFIQNGSYTSPDYTTGSFNITSPRSGYTAFSILNSAGNGPVTINYTVNYSDGNTDTGSIQSYDWFSSTALIFNTSGRMNPTSPALNNVGGSPAGALHNGDIPLTHSGSVATNISLSYGSGGRAALFAVSASTDGVNFTPIAVSGFDAGIIIPKEQPFFHGGLFTATTATMDQGTNNSAFTLFEKGWVTNGIAAGSGMPPAGGIIASLQAANRFYQIQSYTAPNGVLINSVHTTANITPASPANYSAFAVLVAGGAIGAGNSMSNLCILQHADGVSETNYYLGKDWFDDTLPPAYICNGRIDTRSGTCTSEGVQGNLNPRLFESFFQVSDVGSPVTNIVLQYGSGGGSCYVMAVSATAGAVQPFISQTAATPASPVFEGSNVVFRASVGGTAPITTQWQFSPDGTNWSNLTDGGTISGSTTTNLQINGVLYSNSGQYRLAAYNVAGGTTNFAITYTVYSSLPDVTEPSDPIVAYQPNGGSSPAGFEVVRAIDDMVGTNADYANLGVNGGATPFSGPVGFIVSPFAGKTTVNAARFYPTELAAANDPANWTLEGSNNGGGTWTLITTNVLTLPAGRNSIAATAVNPLAQSVTEIHFPNASGYTSYRVTFWNTANDSVATEIAIGEVELLGTNTYSAPLIAQQPANATVWQGGNPSFTVVATGAPLPLSYQWSRGTVAPLGLIAGATSSRYTLVNAQASDSGATFSCTVSDTQGSTPSTSATLTVSGTKPTTSYAVAVMADQPLALWRLDETDDGAGNNGKVASDHFGGFNGIYTNTTLGVPGYNPTLDSDTAALFGSFAPVDSYVGNIAGIDFSTPTNTAGAMSVEAWVLIGASVPLSGAGIVTKGYGGGGEQFNLDCGSDGSSANFRFFVRDAGGNTHGSANGTIGPTNQLGPFPNANGNGYSWHHVVGVCDEAHSNVVLYVDGISNAAATGVLPSNGIMSSPLPVTIGSRTPDIYTDFINQFDGTIDEVAIYKQALSASQVLNHYYAAHPNPVFTLQPPATVNYSANGPLVINTSAYGPPTLGNQWYSSPDNATWSPVSGQTSQTFNMASTPSSLGPYLQLVVTDPYGSVTSSVVQITVYASGPVILTDLVPTNVVYAAYADLSVTAYGASPLSFQWYKSADNVTYTPLSDSAHIVGSHTNALSIIGATPADDAFYKVIVSNSISTAESVHEYLIIESRPSFNGNGVGWGLNSENPPVNGGTTIVNNVLTLTDGTAGENRSAFYNFPLYIGGFKASFVYQDIGGGGADGTTFCLQNDPRGTTALGGGGGSLGYAGIAPSAALEINIYNGHTVGIALVTNGAVGTYTATTPVNVASGDPIAVSVTYDGSTFSVNLQDTTTLASYSASSEIDLPGALGDDTAFVGFTGSEGGTLSHQTVSNFSFAPLPVLSHQFTGPNSLVLSWPSVIGGYILQSKANLGDTNPADWVTVGTPVSQVNGQNQVTITPLTGGNYYRLILPPSAD